MKKTDFSTLSDDVIVKMVHERDYSAIEYIFEKYKDLVLKKARPLFLIGGDRDDLIQEGMIGLYKATQDYVPDSGYSFSLFADLCVTRQMYNAIKASNRQKNIPLNNYISIYAPLYTEDGASDYENPTSLIDIMQSDKNLSPEEILIDKETRNMIEYELGKRLSSMEKKVYRSYINGLTYQNIADNLHKSTKSIDNALQRIRVKLTSLLQEIQ